MKKLISLARSTKVDAWKTPRTYALHLVEEGEKVIAVTAGCRLFFLLEDAINYWSDTSFRPEFVLALMALKYAVENGEVRVDGEAVALRLTHTGKHAIVRRS